MLGRVRHGAARRAVGGSGYGGTIMSLVTMTLTEKPGRTVMVGWMLKLLRVSCAPTVPISPEALRATT